MSHLLMFHHLLTSCPGLTPLISISGINYNYFFRGSRTIIVSNLRTASTHYRCLSKRIFLPEAPRDPNRGMSHGNFIFDPSPIFFFFSYLDELLKFAQLFLLKTECVSLRDSTSRSLYFAQNYRGQIRRDSCF